MIDGPAGGLEALLEEPSRRRRRHWQHRGATRQLRRSCQPRLPWSATRIRCMAARMINKVVHTLARALQERGMPTLRFNFRGVGASAGSYDEGRGETAGCAGGDRLGPRALAAGRR